MTISQSQGGVGGPPDPFVALSDEHLTEMIISVAVAYGAFLGAEELHFSGVIATLVAGMTLSRLGRTRGWVFSGVTIFQSGTPLVVYTSASFQPTLDGSGQVNGLAPGSGDRRGEELDAKRLTVAWAGGIVACRPHCATVRRMKP